MSRFIFEVEAFRFGHEAVPGWGFTVDTRTRARTGHGDWVLRYPDGRFGVRSDKQFRELYRPESEPTKGPYLDAAPAPAMTHEQLNTIEAWVRAEILAKAHRPGEIETLVKRDLIRQALELRRTMYAAVAGSSEWVQK